MGSLLSEGGVHVESYCSLQHPTYNPQVDALAGSTKCWRESSQTVSRTPWFPALGLLMSFRAWHDARSRLFWPG